MVESIPLEYAPRPKRRLLLRLLQAANLILLIAACIYYRAPIRAYVINRYQDWQFAREFDRISAATVGNLNVWKASSGNVDADKLLNGLLAASAANRSPVQNTVLFVRSGTTGGRPWLTFACIDVNGLELYTFDREDRRAAGPNRVFWTRAFWNSRTNAYTAPRIDVVDEIETGDLITTNVRIDGELNVIDWSIMPAPPTTAAANKLRTTPLTLYNIVPRTGWVSNYDWWPNPKDVELIEGRAAAVQIRSIDKVIAISFVPDGRVAAVSPGSLALVDPRSGEINTQSIPELDTAELAIFNLDGTICFTGGVSRPTCTIQPLTGKIIGRGKSYGMPKPFFVDNQTLLVLDNTRLGNTNFATRESSAEAMSADGIQAYVRANDVLAYTRYGSSQIQVQNLKDHTSIQVPDLSGMGYLSLSPNGKWLASKGQDGISVVDASTGALVFEHNMNSDQLTGLSRIKWSRDGTIGAAAGNSYVYVWSLRTPRWLARFPISLTGLSGRDVAIDPNAKSMAVSSYGNASLAYWPDIFPATRPAQ